MADPPQHGLEQACEAVLFEAALPFLAGRRVWLHGELPAWAHRSLGEWRAVVTPGSQPLAASDVVLFWSVPGRARPPEPEHAAAALESGTTLLLGELSPGRGFSIEQGKELVSRLEPAFEVFDVLNAFVDETGVSRAREPSVLAGETRSPAAEVRRRRSPVWLDGRHLEGTPGRLVLCRRRALPRSTRPGNPQRT